MTCVVSYAVYHVFYLVDVIQLRQVPVTKIHLCCIHHHLGPDSIALVNLATLGTDSAA